MGYSYLIYSLSSRATNCNHWGTSPQEGNLCEIVAYNKGGGGGGQNKRLQFSLKAEDRLVVQTEIQRYFQISSVHFANIFHCFLR